MTFTRNTLAIIRSPRPLPPEAMEALRRAFADTSVRAVVVEAPMTIEVVTAPSVFWRVMLMGASFGVGAAASLWLL